MSWFTIISGLCWVGAAIEYSLTGNWRMVVVSLCYAAATGALVGAK